MPFLTYAKFSSLHLSCLFWDCAVLFLVLCRYQIFNYCSFILLLIFKYLTACLVFYSSFSFIIVHMLSCVWLFVTPWTAACQASLSITISQSLLKLMSIESVMPSNYLVLCRPLLLLPSVFSSIKFFSSELALHIM